MIVFPDEIITMNYKTVGLESAVTVFCWVLASNYIPTLGWSNAKESIRNSGPVLQIPSYLQQLKS